MATARLSKLRSRAAVQDALDEFARLGRDGFLSRHGFGRSRDVLVRNPVTGELCDSKAIVGVAYGIEHPSEGSLRPEDFSGGEATVARLLRAMGFEVVNVGEDWSREEVELIVADYLSMLTMELTGQPFNKTSRRRMLISRLQGRSEGAVEFKHCNISAVMLELGYPYVMGYKPRANFQRKLLIDVVSEAVQRYQLLDAAALSAVSRPAHSAEPVDFSRVRAAPPRPSNAVAEHRAAYHALIKRDYLEQESRN